MWRLLFPVFVELYAHIECINPPCYNFPGGLSSADRMYVNLGLFHLEWTDARDLCEKYDDRLYTLSVQNNQEDQDHNVERDYQVICVKEGK